MKRIIKYAAVAFALILAASIIGGCLTAGVAVVRKLVEKTADRETTEGGRTEAAENGLWHRDENGDIIFMGIRFGNNGAVKSGSEEFAGKEISAMEIEGLSGELILEAWDGNTILVTYENIAEEYEIFQDGEVLKIQCDKGWLSINTSFNQLPKIHVQVPANQVLENVNVDKGSGSMKMTGITADSIQVDSGSGSVNISEVSGEELAVESGSGSVKISGVAVKEFRVDSGSGSVTVEEVAAEKTVLDSGSGTVTVKNSSVGETRVDTGSGFVNFEEVDARDCSVESGSGRVNFLGALTGECKFDTSSGSVNLELYGEEEDYNIWADLGSGGLYINGDKVKDTDIEYDDAENTLRFEAGSGRISIKFQGARETGETS